MSSSVSCGIVGLPNVGKSTLFNSLTKARALVANYPFATIDPNIGIVSVPDKRLKVLADMFQSDKITPATMTFVDIAGLVAGASKGEGLGNQFLSHIRSCQAIVEVVRDFKDSNIAHVDNMHNPAKDIGTLNTELMLADLQTLEKRLSTLEKETKADNKLSPKLEATRKAIDQLNKGTFPLGLTDEELDKLSDLQLLSTKPLLYLFNLDEADLANTSLQEQLANQVAPAKCLFLCAKLELELSELSDDDQQEMLASYGLEESGLNKLVKAAYDLLGLQSFLTAGQKEARAWTIKKGALAPQAAGVIHTDFEKGFIAAEAVNFDDLVEAGSLAKARSLAKVRTEGKTYAIKEDDVLEFRFNVS